MERFETVVLGLIILFTKNCGAFTHVTSKPPPLAQISLGKVLHG